MDSSLLQPGPSALFEEETGNVILLRSPDNVYGLAWNEPGEVSTGLVQLWNDLFEMAFRASRQTGGMPEPAPEGTATGN
jgi:hypothetical protein